MTVDELIGKLQRCIRLGTLDPSRPVLLRNTAIDEDAMDRGEDGYAELDEALIAEGRVRLLMDEYL